MEQHAEILIGKPWHQRNPGWYDVLAVLLMVAVVILLGLGGGQMAAPFVLTQQPRISLSPSVLPEYALRTTMRMLAALLASLIFTMTYATADLPTEISNRLSHFLKSPRDMFTFDSQPCAGADGERRILLNPSDSLLHFLQALRKWNLEEL